ncbi:hypothetical protein QTP88_014308 [Uroleucon formosanum]
MGGGIRACGVNTYNIVNGACAKRQPRQSNILPRAAGNEAKGLMNKMSSLEIAIMSVVWGFLLSRLNLTSNKLQNVNIDCLDVLKLYDSLIRLIEQTRENFDDFETEALAKAGRKNGKSAPGYIIRVFGLPSRVWARERFGIPSM